MNKLTIHGREYSRTQLKNNILKVYKISGAGKGWYIESNELAVHLSSGNSLSIAQCAGIIAALSPQKSWPTNKMLAYDFIEFGKRSGHMPVMIDKAEQITRTKDIQEIAGILNGPKITNFFYNILNPVGPEHVTIDRHALGVAICGTKRRRIDLIMTDKQYKTIASAYKWTAEQLGILPLELQAMTWITYRQLTVN